MSGIAGFVNFDDAPADAGLASAMADSLAFRGPDASKVWTDGMVALVQTLLRSTLESEFERQPASFDGRVWITADARIDGRADLIGKMGVPEAALAGPDSDLILLAYGKWGEQCVEHLLGDFAFAIWDGPKRKVFCARDHFGVKPFYYAEPGKSFVFSNTLNSVRLHPEVGDELNELAIADFLLFDYNQDLATTTFRDIRKLPPAHSLTVTSRGASLRRYWSLPEGERIRHRRTTEYVEHFRSVFGTAVADRLRTRRLAIMMSGGLDSSAVAAFARKADESAEIRAYTWISESLIPDDERHYAGLVAKELRASIEYLPLDEHRPFAPVTFPTPEPYHAPRWEYEAELKRRIGRESRVLLTGEGGDPLLVPSPLLSATAIRSLPPLPTAIGLLRYALEFRAIPKIRLRSTLRTLLGQDLYSFRAEVPRWIRPDFVERWDLAGRAAIPRDSIRKQEVRPLVRRYLRSNFWPRMFEVADAAWSHSLAELRHPFFDTRVVRFCLAIPDLPHSIDKYLLRTALKGMIPEEVRKRPKTRAQADPLDAAYQKHGLAGEQHLPMHPRLSNFVDTSALPFFTNEGRRDRFWVDSRPISLNNWITSLENTIEWKTKRTPERKLLTAHPV